MNISPVCIVSRPVWRWAVVCFVLVLSACSNDSPSYSNQQDTDGENEIAADIDEDAASETEADIDVDPELVENDPDPVEEELVEYGLRINEVAAAGEPFDWFELYNTTDHAISLAGLRFGDNIGDEDSAVAFPEGASVEAGGFYLVSFEEDWPGFGLGQKEELALFTQNGNVLDSVDWAEGDSPEGKSYGRLPDGTGVFRTLDIPSPGATNEGGIIPGDDDGDQEEIPPTLVINELAANGTPYDWFELFNATDEAIDLNGYQFTDDLTTMSNLSAFPADTVVESGGYVVFTLTNVWPGFKLGSDEELGVLDPDGEWVDSVNWNSGDSPEGKSYGRIPDGTGEFEILDTPTPGASNEDEPLPGDGDQEEETVVVDLGCSSDFGCEWDEGCTLQGCGSCQTGNACKTLEGCLPDGHCGACTENEQCADGTVCLSGFCFPATLPQWSLTIDPDRWAEMRASPYDDIWTECELEVDGVTYNEGCTVRLLGGTSRGFRKKSFRIEFSSTMPHPGFSNKINLRAEYDDPSFLRSFLGYEVFRRLTDLPTPRAHFVQLQFNGEMYGLMLEVERIDGEFLDARGLDSSQSMYEADSPVEYTSLGISNLVPLPETTLYPIGYSKKTGESDDYTDLIDLIENHIWLDYLDAPDAPMTTDRTASAIDMDRYLRYLAVMGAIQNHDHVRKNYFFSWQMDANGEYFWEFYPWDLNLTFGCLWTEEFDTICNSQDTSAEEPYSLIFDEDFMSGRYLWDGDPGYEVLPSFYNLLIHLALSDPDTKARFDDHLCDILQSSFWNDRLPLLIDGLQTTLSDAVASDPNDLNPSLETFEAHIQELKTFLAERKTFLLNVLGCSENE